MNSLAPEYVAARSVLLDALMALGSHVESVILVGAQAIYQHTGVVAGTGIVMTTDADLALDVDLLAASPELAQTLQNAGFLPDDPARGGQPGSWVGAGGIKVDLMVVPHQSAHKRSTARSAVIPPHAKKVARITPGLEPALVDYQLMPIAAFDSADERVVNLRVGGPAALLVAKLIKVSERQEQVALGGAHTRRIKGKDVVDIYRFLLAVPTDVFVKGFGLHSESGAAEAVARQAVRYLEVQQQEGRRSHLRTLLRAELPEELVVEAQFEALVEELLIAVYDAGLFL